jgi:guanyl-specific ribonuclease Sa
LAEIKNGGADTHELAKQAGIQASAVNRQATNTELLAKAAQTQAAESTAASNTALKELELSERPWVDAVMTIDGPFAYDINGVHITFKVQLLNTGHSVAVGTELSPRMTAVFSDGTVPDAAKLLQDACADETRIVTQMPFFGVSLFPNHPMEQTWTFGIGKDDFAHYTKRIPGQITGPEVVVCIGYRSTFANRIYHTGYSFDLFRIDDKGTTREDFRLVEDVPQNELKFRCSPSNCVVAD